jgi:predicted nucleic acid-binding protein
VVYLFVPGPFTEFAEKTLLRDSVWLAPPLHRYELLNVMATHVRKAELTLPQALIVLSEIARTVEVVPDADQNAVLEASIKSRIATYDCEYVVLARSLGLRVVTADQKMITAFAGVAIGIADFAARR